MDSIIIYKNNQEYGPYSIDEVKGYLGAGNLLKSDYARTAASTEWTTVVALLDGSQPRQEADGSKVGDVLASVTPTIESTSHDSMTEAKNKAGCFRQGCIVIAVIALVIILCVGCLTILGVLVGPAFNDGSSGTSKEQSQSASSSASSGNETSSSTTSMTRAEWKERLGQTYVLTGVLVPGMKKDAFINLCGNPDHTETIGDDTYWYYECSDGEIELVLATDYVRLGVVAIKQTNEH